MVIAFSVRGFFKAFFPEVPDSELKIRVAQKTVCKYKMNICWIFLVDLSFPHDFILIFFNLEIPPPPIILPTSLPKDQKLQILKKPEDSA